METNFVAVCVADGFGIFLAIMMLGAQLWKNSKNKTEGLLIRLMIYTALLSCAMDIVSFAFDGKAGIGSYIAVYASNFWLYFSNVILGSLWVMILVSHMLERKLSKFQIGMIVGIDSIGAIALIANFFYPIVFGIDSATNLYFRGPVYWLFLGIEGIFGIDGLVTYFVMRKKNKSAKHFPVWQFIVPIVVGVTVQSIFYGISTILPSIVISICGITFGIFSENEEAADILRQHENDVKIILEQKEQVNKYISDIENKLTQIKGLAAQFSVLYFVNLDTLDTENYYLTNDDTPKEAKEIDKKAENFFEAFKNSMVLYCHEDYKKEILKFADPQYMKSILQNRRRYEFRFPCMNAQGNYSWTDMVIMKFSENENDEPVNIAVGYYDTDGEMKARLEAYQRSERDLAAIKGLAQEYDTLHFIDLDKNTFSMYYMTEISPEKATEIAEEIKPFSSFHEESMRAFCHPDYMQEMIKFAKPEEVRKVLEGKNKFTMRFLCNSDTGYKWCEFAIIKLDNNEDKSINRVAFGYTNIEEKVHKEEEQQRVLTDALSAAEYANNAKTEFLFNMSHDIRTPMNAILGYADIAIRHKEDSARVNDSLYKIKSAGAHLLNLINDILEMSRIESGKLELKLIPMDIRKAILRVSQMSQALAISRDVNFKMELGDIKNPLIMADELHIDEVLINLISNAVKYNKENGLVEYRAEQISDPVDGKARYRFTIIDNGIGMSKEFQEHIFEDFARENNASVKQQEGSGLGLAIVKKIIDLAGGTIKVESKQGIGTTMIVEIEFQVLDENSGKEFLDSQDKSVYIPTDKILEGKRVLLVEDNEMNREIAVDILKEIGFEIEEAEDGQIAVNKVKENGTEYYDFIIMDIQMPVMNGYEATNAIRKLKGGKTIPIIALSANAFKEDINKSLEAGMNAHIAKPIDVDKLLSVMRTLSK